MAPFVKNGQKIVNVAKGVEEKTLLTLSEIIEQELPQANVSVLSGPSHAEEVDVYKRQVYHRADGKYGKR